MSKINKTIKLFIAGEFPRTESGRSWPVYFHKTEKIFAQLCKASRKDLRNSVTAAQGVQATWAARSAFNRSQILYRMAEMTEGKREEFKQILEKTIGMTKVASEKAVDEAIQAFIYYAGFADKYQQILGAVNPVNGPHHNFTTLEPIGVIGLFCNTKFNLGKLVAHIAAPISIGNSVVAVLAQEGAAILAPLAEVFATSDLPKGVVNLLTGELDELLKPMASHMEVQAISCQTHEVHILGEVRTLAAGNIKRVIPPTGNEVLSLEVLRGYLEVKTVWHPIGV
jgi:acyl-CoA reductase-like NAD-dependent aldehyde dehydrogenase